MRKGATVRPEFLCKKGGSSDCLWAEPPEQDWRGWLWVLIQEAWAPPRPADLGSQAVKTPGVAEAAPVGPGLSQVACPLEPRGLGGQTFWTFHRPQPLYP